MSKEETERHAYEGQQLKHYNPGKPIYYPYEINPIEQKLDRLIELQEEMTFRKSQQNWNKMSKDKICPFMSRPIYIDTIKDVKCVKMFCCGEDCQAWEKYKPVDEFDKIARGRCRLIP